MKYNPSVVAAVLRTAFCGSRALLRSAATWAGSKKQGIHGFLLALIYFEQYPLACERRRHHWSVWMLDGIPAPQEALSSGTL